MKGIFHCELGGEKLAFDYTGTALSNYVTYTIGKESLWGTNVTFTGNVINGGDDKNMENLFEVITVDKKRNIINEQKTIAKDVEQAKFQTAYKYLIGAVIELSEVTIIVKDLGKVEVEDTSCCTVKL